MEERWARLEEIVRRVIREELSTTKKEKTGIRIEEGRWIGLTPAQKDVWKKAYPAVNVEQELEEMAAWCMSNPNDAPRSKFTAFANTWLKRHQDRHAMRSIPLAKPTPSLCEYCRAPAVGAFEGRRACNQHWDDAVNRVKPQTFMPGIVAKRVVPE